jgi:hypothetical protein
MLGYRRCRVLPNHRLWILLASNPPKRGASAARSLFGHKAKPRRKLTPVLKRAPVADRSDQRYRRHRADAFDLAETLADLAVAIELSDLSIVTRNPRIQFDQFFLQLSHKCPNDVIESAVVIGADDPRQSPPEIADVFCNDDPMLAKKIANLIDEPDAIGDQATANSMNRLHRQLFGGLDGHEAHVWSTDRLADGFRVIPIVLAGLHVGRDELWADQPDFAAKFRNRLRPKVCAVRSFHAGSGSNTMESQKLTADLHIGLVHAPRISRWLREVAPSALELRSIMVHPTHDCGVSNREAALSHHLHQVPEAELESADAIARTGR